MGRYGFAVPPVIPGTPLYPRIGGANCGYPFCAKQKDRRMKSADPGIYTLQILCGFGIIRKMHCGRYPMSVLYFLEGLRCSLLDGLFSFITLFGEEALLHSAGLIG